ncbi:hypothetical protein VPH35_078750 [Triticum aestivum]|uniref:Uncharacterized protein n=1 Tax=Aegilops tauschii TaxID=37682 RepID=M8AVE5_AEGTA
MELVSLLSVEVAIGHNQRAQHRRRQGEPAQCSLSSLHEALHPQHPTFHRINDITQRLDRFLKLKGSHTKELRAQQLGLPLQSSRMLFDGGYDLLALQGAEIAW